MRAFLVSLAIVLLASPAFAQTGWWYPPPYQPVIVPVRWVPFRPAPSNRFLARPVVPSGYRSFGPLTHDESSLPPLPEEPKPVHPQGR